MEHERHRMVLSLEGVSSSEAEELAGELREYILAAAPGVEVLRERADPTSQDIGALLVVVLSAPATLALAKGIQKWLEARYSASVKASANGKSVTVSGLSPRSAESLAHEFGDILKVPPGG